MTTQPILLLLRFIHMVAGVPWVGGAAVLTAFILPAAPAVR
ncbi:MAG TPA: hypothetical protein VGM82_17665 [Gemmatimonadaceae bacterium]|jgi:uncharacterized membrane protein